MSYKKIKFRVIITFVTWITFTPPGIYRPLIVGFGTSRPGLLIQYRDPAIGRALWLSLVDWSPFFSEIHVGVRQRHGIFMSEWAPGELLRR